MLANGTKVRIKSWKKIQKTLDGSGRCDGLYFNPEMKAYCGKVYDILAHTSGFYRLNDPGSSYWAQRWFEVVKEESYLNDGSIEQRSLCLALIRQVMSGNKLDLEYLKYYKGPAFPGHNGFLYLDYPQDKWKPSTRIAENIPDWPCLNLKPEILEEAIKNCLSQHNLEYFKKYISSNISSWFIFAKTEKDAFWYEVAGMSNRNPGISKDTNVEQSFKTKKDEIKFQRKKGCILRGTVPEGNQQSSGKCKATTCSRHLSHKVCTGR